MIRTLLLARVGVLVAVVFVSSCATPGADAGIDRGGLQYLKQLQTLSRAQLDATWSKRPELAARIGPAQCDVQAFEILYSTIGVQGEPADASATLLIPTGDGCTGPHPLLGWSNGTVTDRLQSLDEDLPLNLTLASVFAAHGYATVISSYLGLGKSSYPFHPYLHADSEASAIVDSLRAARRVASQTHIALSGKVMLAGYSQGGHATLATQRTIEGKHSREFDLVASAPMSGPYALLQTFISGWDGRVNGQANPLGPTLFAYTAVSYQHIYGDVWQAPIDVFKAPYDTKVEGLLPGPLDVYALSRTGALPLDVDSLVQPSFHTDFITNTNNTFRQALARNDLLDDWKPQTPTVLCGAGKDGVVDFENARTANRVFVARGATVRVIDVDALLPADVTGVAAHSNGMIACSVSVRDGLFEAAR
ncbi:lipase family protein [Steroidobacter sp.]|uniref:lipase family protein n=1 Tax=Steroidobacter sp. TaxID=1978227 RepID=UPI001A4C9FF2|nr:lipase family protein [Steroidobacter sp.]MBL8271874.1 alpha/beta hydrolase [Steroidobacter sp.]